jgi:predicted RNase H-like HicB family nuclease
MLAYPVDLQPDSNDTLLVTFPDFPEATAFGEDQSDALLRAVDALETVLAASIDEREEIPQPSAAGGRPCVALPALTAAKVLLYQAMAEAACARPISPAGSAGTGRRSTGCSISIMPHAWTRSRRRWPRSASA